MKILLAGAGGYGTGYVNRLLSNTDPDIVWEGIVDPFFDRCTKKDEINQKGIPVYDTMEEFYAGHTADLAVISTPIFLHREQAVCALSHGSYVLCEKPAAATTEDVRAMAEAAEKYGRWVAVGYQWSFSEAMQQLKQDVLAGRLGKPVALKTVISWPRNRAYYRRGGGWAGRITKDGKWVLDSIASNACAHYLHNMLFLLGDAMDTSAAAEIVSGSCLRANDIENFDTCTIKMRAGGAQLYFAASHATERIGEPKFEYTFENGQVTFDANTDSLIHARFADGSTKCYGDPFADNFKKLTDCISAVQRGTTPVCTVKTAYEHVAVVEGIYKTIPTQDFPRGTVKENTETEGVYVEGLYKKLYEKYNAMEIL